MRIGLHSGAVTAGVLRGQNARFQLFGDTMNTAARVESTGMPGRVQISKTTADFLAAAGKVSFNISSRGALNACQASNRSVATNRNRATGSSHAKKRFMPKARVKWKRIGFFSMPSRLHRVGRDRSLMTSMLAETKLLTSLSGCNQCQGSSSCRMERERTRAEVEGRCGAERLHQG